MAVEYQPDAFNLFCMRDTYIGVLSRSRDNLN